MRSYRTLGVVIRRVNFGEADRIVTLLTRDQGKISVIAKGSRKIGSSMSGATELCSYSAFQLSTGATIDVVSQVELKCAFLGLRTSLQRMGSALYALEFCSSFLEEHQSNSDLFYLLLSVLYILEKTNQVEWVLSAFDIQAIALLGYAPQLDVCSCCSSLVDLEDVYFSARLGGVVCEGCVRQYRDSVRTSAAIVPELKRLAVSELASIAKEAPPVEVVNEMRRILIGHVKYRAEREMKTTRFLNRLKAEDEFTGAGT